MLHELATLKTRLGISDSTDDALLIGLSNWVQGRFDKHCQRLFARAEADTYELRGDRTNIITPRYPIEEITAWKLKDSEADGWETQTAPVHRIIASSGGVHLDSPLGSMWERLQITYTGGYVLPGTSPGAGQTALPDEIEEASLLQTIWLYRNKDKLGLSSVSTKGGSVTFDLDAALLEQVTHTLQAYRRYNL